MKKRGNLLIFAAAVCFSLGGLCVKGIPWEPLSINGARCLLSCSILLLFARLTRHRLRCTPGVFLGGGCIVVTNILYTFANKLTTAANTILLQFTAPVFIMLLMWLFLRERPGRLDVAACFLVLGGIFCFFLDSLGEGKLLGDTLALISGLTYAGVFMTNRLPGGDPLSASIVGHLAGAVIGLPFLVRESDFSPGCLLFVLLLGVVQMGMGYVCFSLGIQVTSPLAASLISGVEPILNPVWVAIFLGETITPLSLVGGAIVLLSISGYQLALGFAQRRKPEDAPAGAPEREEKISSAKKV